MKYYFPISFEKIGYGIFPGYTIPFAKVKEIMDKEYKCLPINCCKDFIQRANVY